MTDLRLLTSDVWRDGGSYSATITNGSAVQSYFLRVHAWDRPDEPRRHDRLFVSAGDDPHASERAIVDDASELMRVLDALRGADDSCATDYSRRRFAEMLDAVAVFTETTG